MHRTQVPAQKQSEAYLLEAQRLSNTGSFVWNPSSGKMVWTEEAFRILHYTPPTIPTIELILQRVHPEDLALVRETIECAYRAETQFDHEYRLLLPDRSVRHLHVVARPLRDKAGNVEFVGAIMDVTAAKQVEQTLREREAYLAEAQKLTHTGSGAWRVAGENALYLSEEWYRIYGFDPQHGLSAWKDRLARMHPDDRARVQETKDRAVRERSDYEVEHRILLPDGTLKYTHTVGHPVLDASGDVEQFVCTMMDITERKHAEVAREALRLAQEDLSRLSRITTMGELTASLAHELNQPITAASMDAKACLRWLAVETPNLERARAAAARIVFDVKRAGEIINGLRELFRKGPLQREPVDINEVIREMVILLHGETVRHGVFVRMDLASDLPQIMADRVQLQQVLMNLMMNGIEAMKEVDRKRELLVRSESSSSGGLEVSVADTGVGLAFQDLEQLFEAFFTTKSQGTGMGLRISRSIIESHRGCLWVSRNFPHGARFHFTLPIAAEVSEPAPQALQHPGS